MLRIAGVQFVGHADREANLATAERLVRDAAARGAKIACLPELFNTMYFCVDTKPEYFDWAEPVPGPTTERMGALAASLGIVLIAPVFEKAPDGHYFNTAAVLGPDGRFIGKYRKSSIPFMDASRSPEPRGNEKYFFSPGDLGFPTFDTPFARIGILICYDRHFPEAARILGLKGAHLVVVPTATYRDWIREVWEVELRGHAVANMFYVGGVNKVGPDVGGPAGRSYFGSAVFIDPRGNVIGRAGDKADEILYADIDPRACDDTRDLWGFFKYRRPDAYGEILGLA
jgi:N-carbamoylputrescine amidase